VFLRPPIPGCDYQGRMQTRLSARSSGVVESSRSGGGSDSEFSPMCGRHRRTTTEEEFAVGNFKDWELPLQLGSPSGGVNFFNAICRLLMYEGSFSPRFSDLLISTDSFVCTESVSAGVGLRSAFSLSIDPLQLINTMVSITSTILNSRQARCIRSEKCFHKWHKPQTRCAAMLDSKLG
jgi:hypothetical protein